MKKIVFVLLLVLIAVSSVSAQTRLINFSLAFHGQWYSAQDQTLHSSGLTFAGVGNPEGGFYYQVTPYVATKVSSGGSSYKFEVFGGELIPGLSMIYGYGKEFDWGSTGLLLGGGLLLDLQYDTYYYTAQGSVGAALGLNFLINFGNNGIFNIGLVAGWRPYTIYYDVDYGDFFDSFSAGGTYFTLNAGFGWRKGENRKTAERRASSF